MGLAVNKSKKQEINGAKFWGGYKQPASGAFVGRKSDIVVADLLDGFRIECKRTDSKSIRISVDILEKIWIEAMQNGQKPIVEIEFSNKYLFFPKDNVWCVIQRKDLMDLIERSKINEIEK